MKIALLLIAMLAVPATAQTAAGPAVIRVIGHGVVRTPPDLAVIEFGVRGEGATPDAAVRALGAIRERIDVVLAGKAQVRTGRLGIAAARDRACADDQGNEATRLLTGPCAIRGYVAILPVVAKVTVMAEAGTLTGLVARLGATDPSIDRFEIFDPAAARRSAVAAAIADARAQAGAIAAASGIVLGRLRRVEDQRASNGDAQDVVVTGSRMRPPAEAAAPIAIALAPDPIETSVTLVVEFDIVGARP